MSVRLLIVVRDGVHPQVPKVTGGRPQIRVGQMSPRHLLAGVLLLSGCTASSASDGSGPQTVGPNLAPDLNGTMTVKPALAGPGAELALRFQADNHRGIAFSLSQWDEGQWEPAYYLTSLTSEWGQPGNYQPHWWPVDDSETRGWQQIGISGTGPDRVLVPDTATPGDHLLCTANAVDEACALLKVTD